MRSKSFPGKIQTFFPGHEGGLTFLGDILFASEFWVEFYFPLQNIITFGCFLWNSQLFSLAEWATAKSYNGSFAAGFFWSEMYPPSPNCASDGFCACGMLSRVVLFCCVSCFFLVLDSNMKQCCLEVFAVYYTSMLTFLPNFGLENGYIASIVHLSGRLTKRFSSNSMLPDKLLWHWQHE